MREIKFRGKNIESKNWIIGSLLIKDERPDKIMTYAGYKHEIIPETIGQFTETTDKHETPVYEGDIIEVKTPYRSTQTHTGDNIPNGSYTEPMEPEIRTEIYEIIFQDSCFGVLSENDEFIPLMWIGCYYDLEGLKDAVCWRDCERDIFEDPDEGDLNYLLEQYKMKNLDELLELIRGFKIIGNIHENPELLK